MAKTNKQLAEEALAKAEEAGTPVVIKPPLIGSAYVMYKDVNTNNWYTAKVRFDNNLTYAEFSDKEIAGDEKNLAIEKLKILLATHVF